MPVKRIEPKRSEHPDLVNELVRVLQANSPAGPPGEPEITIEELRHSNSLHVTVIWTRWKGVDPETRGEVILDAIARAFGEADMLRVTQALGATPEEAARLGLRT